MSDFERAYDDPLWKEKRKAIIARDGGACVDCGSAERLQVHHGYYQRVGGRQAKPWEYEDETLWTLCESCHERATGVMAEMRRRIGGLHPRQLEAVLETIRSRDGSEVENRKAALRSVIANLEPAANGGNAEAAKRVSEAMESLNELHQVPA